MCKQDKLFSTFLLNNQEFAINVDSVNEIMGLADKSILPVPASPEFILGIINIRGTVIPVIDLNIRFKLPNSNLTIFERKLAITRCGGNFFGLVCDQIVEVLPVDNNQIDELLGEVQENGEKCISGIIKIDERVIQIINPDYLFSNLDLENQTETTNKFGAFIDEQEDLIEKNREQCISFVVHEQEFGIAIQDIREIIKVPKIDKKALSEEYIKGFFVLRDNVHLLIDMRMYLGDDPVGKLTENHRILIFHGKLKGFAVLVDSVNDVVSYDKNNIKEMPTVLGNNAQGAFKGVIAQIGNNIILLDIDLLFQDTLIENVEKHIKFFSQTGNDEDQHKKNNINDSRFHNKVLITFGLQDILAAEIDQIHEIIRYENNLMVPPGRAKDLEGLLNLRGDIIPIVDLRKYYGISLLENTSEQKIIIINEEEKKLGLLVDDIFEIVKIDGSDYVDVPTLLRADQGKEYEQQIIKVIEVINHEGDKNTLMVFDVDDFINKILKNEEYYTFKKNEESTVENEEKTWA